MTGIYRFIFSTFAASALLLSGAIAAPAFAQTPDDYGVAAASTYCPVLSSTMTRGARDAASNGQVSELQKFLADYYDIDPVEFVTGYFGRITQGYVVQFQKEQGLPAFGIAGQLTRAKIATVCKSSTSESTTSTKPSQVSSTATPVVSVKVSPASVSVGQGAVLSWSSTNANRCILSYGSSQESISVSGSKTVGPSQTTSYKIWCANDSGTGKDGPASSATATLSVTASALQVPTISFQAVPSTIGAAQSATLSWSTSNANRCVLQYGSSEENIGTNGSKVVSPSQTTSYKIWCANDSGTGKDGPAASQNITVAVAAPSCTLTTNKSSYKYGETINFSWTSQNATHASFKQDTSGKDHLLLPGDKLVANGTQPVVASVIGNPSATLVIYNYAGTSSCSVTVPVTE